MAEDAAALSLVGGATFLQTYAAELAGADIVAHCRRHNSPESWDERLANAAFVTTIAEHAAGGAPLGYTLLTPPDFPGDLGEGAIELKRIYLLAAFHGTGLGPALMDAAIADARALGWGRIVLGTHPRNLRAHRFYERFGFRRIGRRSFTVGAVTHDDPVYALDL